MSKILYQDWNPGVEAWDLIGYIGEILEDYEAQGYKLTLRQLYYQLVSKDLIENTVRSYKRIGNIVNRGRLAGLIDWEMIEDRGRVPKSRNHWESTGEMLDDAALWYYRSRWEDQEYYVEVWSEKDAVSNILEPVCRKWDVTFMANRGYSSQSAMWEAGNRLWEAHENGKAIGVLYLGDHDPSGIDMIRDIRDRLGVFINSGEPFGSVVRLALNMDQIDQYNPPENPAKVTDSRFKGYVQKYGRSSYELDALEPKVLADLVDTAIGALVDGDKWEAVVDLEEEHKQLIRDAGSWIEEAEEGAEDE